MKKFTYVIEHMEDTVDGWPKIEYMNMIKHMGSDHVVLSHLKPELLNAIPCITQTESVQDWPVEKQKRVLLLDPSSPHELKPEDATDFDYLLFGGILGDDPPQDRTKILRNMGFATRHLGSVQMTTDTAVLVSQQVLEFGHRLVDLKFVDFPEIKLGKKQSVEMPFRYLVDEAGNPKMPPGLIEHLKASNDEPLV
ncbi:SAM-dependent RNA methyltransferase [Globomyces pollinis-pini]|nr:SAM-dependent RNA methyltransferase [Globomyces pollinis-pini]